MTNILLTDSFDRPAAYWLRRAEKHRQKGDLIRAAVLERHAARTNPGSDAALARYAQTLRELHCYEASNREAFAALAQKPDRRYLYGLIAQNLMAMGRTGEGLDAASLYTSGEYEAVPAWNDDVYDMQTAWYPTPPRRKARLEGLLHMAALRLARGDNAGARRFLNRALQKPFQGPCARRDELMALWHEGQRHPEKARELMQRAVALESRNSRLLCSAACLFHRLGDEKAAKELLLKAAVHANGPSDELTVCLASDLTQLPGVAYAMLNRALRRQADRYPVCFHLCVCHLRMGQLEQAARCLNLCRQIDPDDVSGQWLAQLVEELARKGASPEEVKSASQGAAYYGAPCAPALEFALLPVAELLAQGPQALADALSSRPSIRRFFLYALLAPMEWPVRLLPQVCRCMPAREAEALLREILLQADVSAKTVALEQLCALSAPTPYLVRREGRIFCVDPSQPPPAAPTFCQRFLTRRLRQAARLCPEEGFLPWALEQAHRMSRNQRLRLAADAARIWPLALALRYQALRGLGPVAIDIRTLNNTRARELRRALHCLRTLTPKEAIHHENH